MNNVLSNACILAFFLLPVVVLCVRAQRPKLMPWWLALLVVALLGWLFSIGIVEFHFAALADQIRAYGEHAPEDLRRQWATDTGRPFVFMLGWIYGPIYFIPCVAIYTILQLVSRCYANRNA